jgi:hypothetical protein
VNALAKLFPNMSPLPWKGRARRGAVVLVNREDWAAAQHAVLTYDWRDKVLRLARAALIEASDEHAPFDKAGEPCHVACVMPRRLEAIAQIEAVREAKPQ